MRKTNVQNAVRFQFANGYFTGKSLSSFNKLKTRRFGAYELEFSGDGSKPSQYDGIGAKPK